MYTYIYTKKLEEGRRKEQRRNMRMRKVAGDRVLVGRKGNGRSNSLETRRGTNRYQWKQRAASTSKFPVDFFHFLQTKVIIFPLIEPNDP